MTHELIKMLSEYEIARGKKIACVLVSVVALEGSSYRRPGVRMLLLENGTMIGAVSGGCVEKEIKRQASVVFKTNIPKMVEYDGRFRLGCEGLLYILIEPFSPDNYFLEVFKRTINNRDYFRIETYFSKDLDLKKGLGSVFHFDNKTFNVTATPEIDTKLETFRQEMNPCFKLIIIGTEHDAVVLAAYAALTGWKVTVVTTLQEEKKLLDFPGANELIVTAPEQIPVENIDEQTAIVLMTHSYVKDLKYLQVLKKVKPAYLGVLGPIKRREKLLNNLFDYSPDVSEDFLESIHGPAGLDIGAETPQEIAISVVSEILSVVRKKDAIKLSNKFGAIHI